MAELNDLPVRTVRGATIYIRDVAHVRDGYPPQTNIVRSDGQRGSLMSILKSGNVSSDSAHADQSVDRLGGIGAARKLENGARVYSD